MGYEYIVVAIASALAGIGTGLVGLSAATAMVRVAAKPRKLGLAQLDSFSVIRTTKRHCGCSAKLAVKCN